MAFNLPSAGNDVKTISEYTLLHLAFHLHESHQLARLFQLLIGSNRWLDAKFDRFGDDSLYVDELELALTSLVDPLTPEQILKVVQLHAARHLVHEREAHYEDKDLEILVLLGHREQAERHARLRDADTKFYPGKYSGLMAICRTLREIGVHDNQLLEEVRQVANQIRDDEKQQAAFSELAVEYAANGNLQGARELVQSILKDGPRTSALVSVAAILISADKLEEAIPLIEAAQNIAASLSDPLEYTVAQTGIVTLMAKLGREAEGNRLFAFAQEKAVTITNTRSRDAAFTHIAVALSTSVGYERVKDLAKQIEDPHYRFDAICQVAVMLSEKESTEECQVAIDDAHAILETFLNDDWRDFRRMRFVATLATCKRFSEAKNLVEEIKTPSLKQSALRHIAFALAHKDLITEAEEIWKASNQLIWGVPYNVNREATVYGIALALIEISDFQNARIVTETIRDKQLQRIQFDEIETAEQNELMETRNVEQLYTELTSLEEIWLELSAARGLAEDGDRFSRLRKVATKYAQIRQFSSALSVPEIRLAYQYLQLISEWASYFEQVEAGLFVKVIRECTRIYSWLLPAWQDVNIILGSP